MKQNEIEFIKVGLAELDSILVDTITAATPFLLFAE